MVVHGVESGAFQVEVDVDGEEGVIANLHCLERILIHEAVHDGGVVWGIVLGEIFHVCSELCLEDLGYAELQIEICV